MMDSQTRRVWPTIAIALLCSLCRCHDDERVTPSYAEARAAESAVDFIHKLGLVLKELNESRVSIEMIRQRQLVVPGRVQPALEEWLALSKIISASRRTAAENTGEIRKAQTNYPLSKDNACPPCSTQKGDFTFATAYARPQALK